MALQEAFIALNRFGLGARPGELERVSRNPKEWLRSQITEQPAIPETLQNLPHSSSWFKAQADARHAGKEARKKLTREIGRPQTKKELQKRIETAIRSDQPFKERLAIFWANHFTVSGKRPLIAPAIGGFEREAIRPHLFSKFEDMLLAVAQHPVMLHYLDNAISIGPKSKIGKRRDRGLNENLAREILELHTLGGNGGYDQKDVTEFAKVLTGWTIDSNFKRLENTGRFYFLDRIHEPGQKILLGTTFYEDGYEEGVKALKLIANHPSTARHIAKKLARHFVADEPSDAVIAKLENVFMQSGGDLKELSLALIDRPECWENSQSKVKNPFDYVVSVFRSCDAKKIPGRLLIGALNEMGYFLFFAPSPEGWSDKSEDWLMPEMLMRRIEFSDIVSGYAYGSIRPSDFFNRTIAPVASFESRDIVLQAPSAKDALAITLASPEFQRR